MHTRTARALAAIAIAAPLALANTAAAKPHWSPNKAPDSCPFVAHRSGSTPHVDELTTEAIARVGSLNGWAEFDVRPTSDGIPVLMHDSTVNRTTDGTGPIENMTWAQVTELRTEPNGSRVPSFAQGLAAADSSGVVGVVAELQKYGRGAWTDDRVADVIELARAADVRVYLGGTRGAVTALDDAGYRWTFTRPDPDEPAAAPKVKMTMPNLGRLDAPTVARLHRLGYLVAIRNTDTAPEWKRAHRIGIDLVQTNRPQRFAAARCSK